MFPDAVKPFSPEDTKVTFQSASMYDKKDYNKINFLHYFNTKRNTRWASWVSLVSFGAAETGLLIVPTSEGTARNHQFLEGIIA